MYYVYENMSSFFWGGDKKRIKKKNRFRKLTTIIGSTRLRLIK